MHCRRKKRKHTEPDLLELLEKHDMRNKEIYLSSFYCPCICLNKLSSFALKISQLNFMYFVLDMFHLNIIPT